jgi:uncharacterized protein YqjF (DUF2071 family)
MPAPTWDQRLALRDRLPGRPVMTQCWDRLLFLHWRVPADGIQARLPPGLTVDTCEGDAWLGIVPFFMRDIRIRGLPPIPTAANFLELNLRTYVYDERGIPGVWFFSLDANSWLTVQGARTWFRLPYRSSRMSALLDDASDAVDYRAHRRGAALEAASRFHYRPRGPARTAEPGSLEFFLIERYLLFSLGRRGRLFTGRVWHEPYAFADAQLDAWDDRLLGLNGFDSLGRPPDHAVVSRGVCVDVFGLQRCVQDLGRRLSQ